MLNAGGSDGAAAREGPDERHLVGVLEVAADGEAAGDPGDAADRPSRRSARYIAVASPSSVGFVARMTSTSGSRRLASSARPRSSRIFSRSGPMPSIGEIAPWRTWYWPLNSAGPLEREDVERLLDDAQPGLVAAVVATDQAERRITDVEAAFAEDDLLPDGDERRREGPGLGVGRAEQVVREPLRGLGPDAGQARERFDQPGDRLDQEARTRVVDMPGRLQAAGDRRHLLVGQLADARSASLTPRR